MQKKVNLKKMKWKTKCILVICVGLLAICCGCSENEDLNKKSKISNSSKASNITQSNDGTEKKTTEIITNPLEVYNESIKEQVVYDKNNIKIKTIKYENNDDGDFIILHIENKTNSNISIVEKGIFINNICVSEVFIADVNARESVNEKLYLSASTSQNTFINPIGEVNMHFSIFESDSNQEIEKEQCITIKTSEYNNMNKDFDFKGSELLNEKGIIITGKYVENDNLWKTAVILYVENNTGKNITINFDAISINGSNSECMLQNHYILKDAKFINGYHLSNKCLNVGDKIKMKLNIIDKDSDKTIIRDGELNVTVR